MQIIQQTNTTIQEYGSHTRSDFSWRRLDSKHVAHSADMKSDIKVIKYDFRKYILWLQTPHSQWKENWRQYHRTCSQEASSAGSRLHSKHTQRSCNVRLTKCVLSIWNLIGGLGLQSQCKKKFFFCKISAK